MDWRRWFARFSMRAHDRELEREISDHLELEVEERQAAGLSHDQARRAAFRAFGSRALVLEEVRGRAWLTGLAHDVRYAVRSLRRTPGFAVAAILTLALGIGANTAIFSVIRAVLLRPLPYADADRLVRLSEQWPNFSGPRPVSMRNYLDWAAQNTAFEQMVAVSWGDVTVGDGAQPVYVTGSLVSPAYFDVFGLRAALGRTFAANDGEPASERVVVISHRLWVSQFGADPAVLGRAVRLDRQIHTIVGVMPPQTGLEFFEIQLWRPLTFDVLPPRGGRQLRYAVAKLKNGVTHAQARAEMTAIADRLAREYPESNKGYGIVVEPYPRPIGLNVEPSLYVLFAAAVVVLLIACANLANLALVRGGARAREVAIRTALGASRARLIRQFLTEHLLIAAGGVVGGVGLGYVLLHTMMRLIPTSGLRATFPPDTTVVMDAPVWLFALGVCLMSGIAFGLAPAVAATSVSLTDAIKTEGGPGISAGRGQRRVRQVVAAAEVALAFVLLTAAILLIRSFDTLTDRVASGYESTNVLTAGLPTAPTRFESGEALNAYLDEIARRIHALPGIRDVAFADALPTQGTPYGARFQLADQPLIDQLSRPNAGFKVVSPSYFRAVGLRLVAGRALGDNDRQGSPLVVVINESLARAAFQGMDPVGQRILLRRFPIQSGATVSGPGRQTVVSFDLVWTIVGVVADESVSPFARAFEPAMYATREQYPRSNLALVVRTTRDPETVQDSVRRTVAAFDHDQALSDLKTLDLLKAEDVAPDRLRSILLGAFAVVALGLAAIGVYGVMAYAVALRTREIGIRAALGASKANLLALVVRQGMSIVVLGLGTGFATALVVTRLLEDFLYGVGAWDPVTMAAAACLLTALVLMACYFPARRASWLDPLVALRAE
ncbi:MAG: ADOP family duplicated permease [Vicinamibacterales bacterium]